MSAEIEKERGKKSQFVHSAHEQTSFQGQDWRFQTRLASQRKRESRREIEIQRSAHVHTFFSSRNVMSSFIVSVFFFFHIATKKKKRGRMDVLKLRLPGGK